MFKYLFGHFKLLKVIFLLKISHQKCGKWKAMTFQEWDSPTTHICFIWDTLGSLQQSNGENYHNSASRDYTMLIFYWIVFYSMYCQTVAAVNILSKFKHNLAVFPVDVCSIICAVVFWMIATLLWDMLYLGGAEICCIWYMITVKWNLYLLSNGWGGYLMKTIIPALRSDKTTWKDKSVACHKIPQKVYATGNSKAMKHTYCTKRIATTRAALAAAMRSQGWVGLVCIWRWFVKLLSQLIWI